MDNQNKNTDSQTIDLTHLLQICRKHIWALILWSVGLAFLGWAVSSFIISPKYSASAQLLVNQKNKTDPNTVYVTQQANMQLVTTYKDIATSTVVLTDASKRLANPVKVVKKAQPAKYKTKANGKRVLVKKAQPAVIERSGKSYSISAGELAGSISVTTQQQSQVFAINATANTPEKAKVEANAVAEAFKAQIPKIMNVNNVTILAPATNGSKTFPKVKLFTLAGFVIGLILSFAIVLIKEMSDTTVRDDDYLTETLGLTNLGQIARFHVASSFKINSGRKSNKRRRV